MNNRIALVYPYFRTKAPTEMLFPPLGIAMLAGQLRLRALETRIFDCTFQTPRQLIEALKTYQPGIVGIYSMVTLSRNTFSIAKQIREQIPDCMLVAGGPLPTLYPEQYVDSFDIVFRGEADIAFPQFCHDLLNLPGGYEQLEDLSLGNYAGLFLTRGGVVVQNPPNHYCEEEIKTFPLPYRGDFDHGSYQNVWRKKDGSKTTSIMTTLGCPFNCDFCSRPVFGNLFRRRELDLVFEEIEEIARLGYNSLWVADDNFTLDLNYLEGFCNRISGANIQWSCLSRVTGINKNVARLMKKAGCRRVYLGLESGNQDTLKLMKKQATLDQGMEAVHLFKEAGIETAGFFIVGYPGETISSIEDTFRFALKLPLDEISFNVPFPLPGSKLFERVSGLDKKSDWNVENEITFVYQSEFDQVWLRRRIRQTINDFRVGRK